MAVARVTNAHIVIRQIMLDMILFKGKSHQKRLQGISLLRDKLLTDERLEGMNIEMELKDVLNKVYNVGL